MRSILSLEKLHKFINYLEDHNIDICCVTETWFDAAKGPHNSAMTDAGYKMCHAFRDQRGGGGVAICYKNKI